MKKFFYFLFLSLALASCHKDLEETIITEDLYTPPVIKINGSIIGVVRDNIGREIEGAVVRVGNEERISDGDGRFYFRNIPVDANGTFVHVEMANHFQASRRVFPKPNAVNYAPLTLIIKENTGTVDAATGGTIQVANGVSIKLPANGIVTSDGAPYAGLVSVSAEWLNPASSDIYSYMPGNLQGINSENEEVALGTYGMMAVELNGTGGTRLNLAPGFKAELKFFIPTQLQGSAPAEIPLWYFDEKTGLWREEGIAVKQGLFYVGEVSHFSFWNCDAPFPVVKVEGRILTSEGQPLSNIYIRVNILGTILTGGGFTDNNGYFIGKMPAGQSLEFEITDGCEDVIHTINVGPLNADTNLGDITIPTGSTDHYRTITGVIVNCDNEPVSNGVVRACQYGNCYYSTTDATGNVDFGFFSCNTGGLTIKAFDLDAVLESITLTFPHDEDVNLGTLAVCAGQIEEFIHLNINGNEVTYLLPYSYGQAGALRHVAAFAEDSSYTFNLSFPVGAPGSYTGQGVGFSSHQISPVYFVGSCQNPCSDVTINVTEFGNIGEFIRGTFSGNVDFRDSNQQTFPNLPVSGEFSVIRLQ